MSQLDELNKLCDAFEGKATKSEHRFYKREINHFNFHAQDTLIDYKTEVVEAVAIHIPNHRLNDFLGVFDERHYREMEIRDTVPAVKIAYERYQLLLKMCGGCNDAGY